MSLDEEIKALQEGNSEGWPKIVDRYRDRIFALLLRFTQDRWELEDISQEVWMRLYTKISLYDFRYPFYTWVLKVTTNVAINYKRKRRWWERLSRDVPGKKSFDTCEFFDEIHKPLSLLDKKARIIFLLYHYESHSAKEIAQILNTPVGTVKSSLSRSSKLLQNFFGGRT
ncbi:RNA polymerase sigma factor [Candidatus Uabimicrobium amorphum]|uniref:ECF RNA polymerase sigma factor SigW n=1 Tax=Uabimicrobium amorphum TaxID=2596890 RepID=A0A5S9F2F2_UABAM|nr:sigma-70 family RNA polymerase sigma factor [Candidatus Uabimicrobium amorphum]BBM83191.1 ECF RNA polymerase sigma factor SigW [Candidatus Uabimicrobium amorphum]